MLKHKNRESSKYMLEREKEIKRAQGQAWLGEKSDQLGTVQATDFSTNRSVVNAQNPIRFEKKRHKNPRGFWDENESTNLDQKTRSCFQEEKLTPHLVDHTDRGDPWVK